MKKRPNIMLLVAEDTGRHHGCYGDPVGHTPNIDRLATEGARYTNAFSTYPVCAPSRGGLACGKIAFSQGFHHMRSRLLKPPRLFTENLREAGYYVNWANKIDFNYEPPESFADDRSNWFDDLANGNLPDQPWLLYHNFEVTHESTMWPEKWEEKVKPFISDEERCDPNDVPVPPYLPDTPEVRQDIARYYEALARQDQLVGQALDALEKSGQRDNTIVIYLSDHGRGLIREKRFPYDAGIHLPLIVRGAGFTERDSVENELVSWLDIAPTILSLCDAKPINDAQGRIFWGPEAQPEPDYVFAARDRMGPAFDRVRCSRSRKYLYMRNDFPELPHAGGSDYMDKQLTTQSAREEHASGRLDEAQQLWFVESKPNEELYDCEADPDNIHNLADDPSFTDTLNSHREALAQFIDRVGDLGLRSERELIDEGLVADMLSDYYERQRPLPERYHIGAAIAPVEMPLK